MIMRSHNIRPHMRRELCVSPATFSELVQSRSIRIRERPA
jgi:hypothetical protein